VIVVFSRMPIGLSTGGVAACLRPSRSYALFRDPALKAQLRRVLTYWSGFLRHLEQPTRVARGDGRTPIADGLKTQSEYRFLPGMSLGWTWDFNLPIKVNDVLHVTFRVGTMRASKSRPGWGIVVLPSELINQDGLVVQHGEHRLMVPRRPGAF
jgi:hypothetical protein